MSSGLKWQVYCKRPRLTYMSLVQLSEDPEDPGTAFFAGCIGEVLRVVEDGMTGKAVHIYTVRLKEGLEVDVPDELLTPVFAHQQPRDADPGAEGRELT